MAQSGALKLKTKLSMLERFNAVVASGSTIIEANWFALNASGEAALATDLQLAFVCFAGTDRPDSQGVLDDPIFGLAGSTTISLGGVTGIRGDYRANVDSTGFDSGGTFSADEALRVNAGLLSELTGSEPIVAFAENPVADGRLSYHTT